MPEHCRASQSWLLPLYFYLRISSLVSHAIENLHTMSFILALSLLLLSHIGIQKVIQYVDIVTYTFLLWYTCIMVAKTLPYLRISTSWSSVMAHFFAFLRFNYINKSYFDIKMVSRITVLCCMEDRYTKFEFSVFFILELQVWGEICTSKCYWCLQIGKAKM